MKKCPQCQTNYFDNMLDFCLEDGAKLSFVEDSAVDSEISRKTVFQADRPTAETTVAFSPNLKADLAETFAAAQKTAGVPLTEKVVQLKKSAVNQWLVFLETAPIVAALLHNYWQWLYLSKLYYSSFTQYVFSSGFLGWFLLLIVGVGLSIAALKYGNSKKFAVTALVVLAINVLLYAVPK